MAYTPPFSGGHFNASISGNTAGAAALVSSGTLTLAGGNNITLSQNGNAISISGGAGIAFAASNSTFTSGTVNLSNAGGALTLSNNGSTVNLSVPAASSLSATGAVSISTNGSTISIGAPNQTNQTLGMYATGANTAGQSSSSTFDARSLSYSGMGNVSVGYSNGSVLISGSGGGGGIALAASNSTFTSGTVNLSNAGGALTLSNNGSTVNLSVAQTSSVVGAGAINLSTAGSSVTISAPTQTVQTQSIVQNVSLSGNTSGVLANINTGTIYLAGGNNIVLSQNANSVTISGSNQSSPNLSLYARNNTAGQGSSSTVLNASTLNFNALGAASLGFSASSIQLSVPVQSVQTQSIVQGASLLTAGNTAGVMANINTGTMYLAGGNNIVLSQNANSVTISGSNQSNQNISLYALGANTTQNSSTVLNASNLSFSGGGNLSVGFSGGTVQLSATGAGGGGGGIALAGTNTTYTSGTVDLLANTNGALTIGSSTSAGGGQTINLSVPATSSLSATGAVSISTNGSTISIGAPNQTNQTLGMYATGANTAGQSSSSTFDARSLSYSGMGNVSVGYSNGSVLISGSAGAQSNQNINVYGIGNTYQSSSASINASSLNISGAGNVSVGASGGTVYISGGGGGGGGTISNWEPMPLNAAGLTNTTLSNGSVYFYPLRVPSNVSASQLLQLFSITLTTSTNTSLSAAVSLYAGIYTANSQSTLQLITQSSGSTAYQFSNTSNNSTSVLTGLRGMSIPINVNFSAGNYWIGLMSKTTANLASVGVSNMIYTGTGLAASSAFAGLVGASVNATQGAQEGVGYYSATSAGMPASPAMSQITQSKVQPYQYMIFKNMSW